MKKYIPSQENLHCLALGAATLGLVLWPKESAQAVRQGLDLCYQVIIPALFPFFILSTMVIRLGLTHLIGKLFQGVMVPVFRLNGNCASALALGFVGGYPVGAKTTITLYETGQCSKTEANRLLAFSNNSGPAFILGVVGSGLFSSNFIGGLVYLAHVLACLTVGFLFRYYKPHHGPAPSQKKKTVVETTSFVQAFLEAVASAASATFSICAFILCFTVIIRLLTLTGLVDLLAEIIHNLLGFPQDYAKGLLIGLIELSSGVTSLPTGDSLGARLSLTAFMLGWAGLSVHCQVLSFIGKSGLSMGTYFLGNFLHGLISALYMWILAGFCPQVSHAFLPYPVEVMGDLYGGGGLAVWVSGGICLCYGLALVYDLRKKFKIRSGKKFKEKIKIRSGKKLRKSI